MILEKLFPETGVKLFSGIALNNATGGINPHAVNHAINIGAQDRLDADALGREPHRESSRPEAKTFPKTAQEDAPIRSRSARSTPTASFRTTPSKCST